MVDTIAYDSQMIGQLWALYAYLYCILLDPHASSCIQILVHCDTSLSDRLIWFNLVGLKSFQIHPTSSVGSRDDANEPTDWSTWVDLLLMVVGLCVAILGQSGSRAEWIQETGQLLMCDIS